AAVALAAALPLAAYANGVVQSMKGDVRAGPVGQTARTVAVDQRLTPGTAVVTGADAQVVLRFDDGQQVVLNQNTEFRIVDFLYEASDSKMDRTVFDLVRGALRMASGAIVGRNRQAVVLRTPQAARAASARPGSLREPRRRPGSRRAPGSRARPRTTDHSCRPRNRSGKGPHAGPFSFGGLAFSRGAAGASSRRRAERHRANRADQHARRALRAGGKLAHRHELHAPLPGALDERHAVPLDGRLVSL